MQREWTCGGGRRLAVQGWEGERGGGGARGGGGGERLPGSAATHHTAGAPPAAATRQYSYPHSHKTLHPNIFYCSHTQQDKSLAMWNQMGLFNVK